MRRKVAVSLLAVALLLVLAAPSHAMGGGGGHGGGHGSGHGFNGHDGFHDHFHGHGVIVVGPGCCWGGPWWDYPPYYYPPYYYPPQVVVEPAPVIGDEQAPQSYWYYCPSAKAYYPTAPTCSEAWIKVPPQ